MINLYNGDCLEIMKSIDSGYIDAIITDLTMQMKPLKTGNASQMWDVSVGSWYTEGIWDKCILLQNFSKVNTKMTTPVDNLT